MKAMTCEMCGSNQFTKKDGLLQCNHCGTKYPLEKVKMIIVDGIVEPFHENKKYQTIIKTGDKFLELDQIKHALLQYKKAMEDFPWDSIAYEKALEVVVNTGYVLFQVQSYLTQWEITNNVFVVANKFTELYKKYYAVADDPKELDYYQKKYYNNLNNGKISFSIKTRKYNDCFDCFSSFEKLVGKGYARIISDTGKKYADYINQFTYRSYQSPVYRYYNDFLLSAFKFDINKTCFKKVFFCYGINLTLFSEDREYHAYDYHSYKLNHVFSINDIKNSKKLKEERIKKTYVVIAVENLKGYFQKFVHNVANPKNIRYYTLTEKN